MYWFLLRPKWIAFHLLVIGAIVLMVSLGMWQLRRLDERREFNAQVRDRSTEQAVPIGELLNEPGFTPDTATWRQVTATGTWLPQQVTVFNRTQRGVAGDNVLTALAQTDGRTVLVNRGFVPLGAEPPTPPGGEVEVLGTVRASQNRRAGELTDAQLAVTEVRRIDIGQLAAQFPGDVAPVYLDLVASTPALGPGDPAPIPPPELSEGPHLSYAGQWFIFSICVLIGWVFAVRRSIRTRQQARLTDEATLTDEASAPAPQDSLRQDADEATTATT